MTAALNSAQRTALNTLIQNARNLLERDLATTLEGNYGIHRSEGRIEADAALSLNARQSAIRNDLLDIIDFLRSEGESAAAAVERLIREAAFTHLNRLIALRVAEGLNILPEVIGQGLASPGFRDFGEIAPAAADEDWERFRLFVRICADELSADVPALFDPRNPLIELEPSTAIFAELVEVLVDADTTIWTAPDALGWSYQFFNSADERREMRKSSAPRNSRELAVRNQFFTPSYVVEFLVQNGLGAHLAAAFPALADELPLLVDVPEPSQPVDLRTVTVLDPACGSGHFLLGAYDVLEAAWKHAGVEPADSAPDIVRSLWGIDIDPRATQIAQAAVIFRARRHSRLPLLRPNVICARALPTGQATNDLIASLAPHVGRAVSAIADELVLAPVLGPLLKIEERLDREAKDIFGTGEIEGTLAEGTHPAAVGEIEEQVLVALFEIADATTSSVSQRLFAAEAHDAVRFVEAMTRRYTAVLMNPPFGEPVADTKPYLKAAYPWIPTKDHNLFAAFVGRGLELAEPETGTCGAITSRTGLFLKTFENWRKEVMLRGRLVAAIDLGHGVMEHALVEAVAYVLANQRGDGHGTFIRLLRESNRIEALQETVRRSRVAEPDDRVFKIELIGLEDIPGTPIAYWMDPSIRDLFGRFGQLGASGDVKQGLATGDDFRFVRAFWEIDPGQIGRSREQTQQGRSWVPFAKGGEYSPYWSDIHLLVQWGNDGEEIREFAGSVVRSPHLYFEPGLTWTLRTASAFGARVLPAGCIFSNKGNIVRTANPYPVLAWLNSRPAAALMAAQMPAADETTSGGASKSYEVGIVARLPWPQFADEEVAALCQTMVERRRLQDLSDELTRQFLHPFSEVIWRGRFKRSLTQIESALTLERALFEQLQFGPLTTGYLDAEMGPHPGAISEEVVSEDRIAELYESPIKSVIDQLIAVRGGSRVVASLSHVADRRLEVIAQGLRVSPSRVASTASARGLAWPNELAEEAGRVLSYLVGCVFGRWDVRVGAAKAPADLPDPFAPVPLTPPGALDDRDRRLLLSDDSSYPIQTRLAGVALDEAGSILDLATSMEAVAEVLFDEPEAELQRLVRALGADSIGHYVRSRFFNNHLARYTMSRRKAPIYWQLQVPSKLWGAWLYYPLLSREILFAVVRETEQRQRLAERRIAALQRELDDGGAGRTISAVSKELGAERKLAIELVIFRDEADRIANLGWDPDLDDGAVLNAAPLADLFPAWKDAAKYRKELRQGKYTWSSVGRFADQL